MMDKDLIQQALKTAVDYSKADQLEVLATAGDTALTRYSNNYIHQNVATTNVSLSIRAVVDKRIGYASTNRLDAESIHEMVDKATLIAKHRPPDKDFVSLPKPLPIEQRDMVARSTLEITPEERARAVAQFINVVEPQNLTAAGAYSTGYTIVGVANTLGVNAIGTLSEAELKSVAMSRTSSAFASEISISAAKIDMNTLANTAKAKALASENPVDMKPGKYTVILEPEAVADIVSFLAFAGFSALAFQEGRSFMNGKIGQQIVSPNVSIWDNAFDPGTIGLPFDFEGVPKQKVIFIEDGVAKGVCYDSYTAHKEGKESTGHALPAPNTYGPLPLNLIMGAGDATFDEMVKSSERAVLVSRFHYTNLEDPIRTTLTGMTRDGTFLIENGKIKAAIKNLRFTQSILEALSNVVMVSEDRQLKSAILGGSYVPYLKINEFSFTGATQF
ncbi:MAG TPA: TldD/PmbA family protein [Candidatus Aquicultor sp.]|jgi:predicted Zn-dependent protease